MELIDPLTLCCPDIIHRIFWRSTWIIKNKGKNLIGFIETWWKEKPQSRSASWTWDCVAECQQADRLGRCSLLFTVKPIWLDLSNCVLSKAFKSISLCIDTTQTCLTLLWSLCKLYGLSTFRGVRFKETLK